MLVATGGGAAWTASALTVASLHPSARTQLNVAWGNKAAPDIAKTYWRLPDDASFLDVIKQVAADETNHRDVNHTFASMESDDPNPYVQKHMSDISKAVEYWQQKDGAIEGKDLDYTMQPKHTIQQQKA